MMRSGSSERSTPGISPIYAKIKLQCWKDVVGGKSRGRVYGTGDLATNFCHGASSLTQPSVLASSVDHDDQLAENAQLKQQILEANAKADKVDKRSAQLEDTVRLMQQQLAMMMKKHVADTSTSTSQVHPHYVENFDDHHVL